ncbi:Uncharacterised protein [Vibrio cholerae]|uniref:Uncharacterized protein n=1 Tax=Vibrio cholerae TaxID=666 RepID=A0A655QJC8_VIBCL|nr:Uncharacterised protein [Vibrio cholerae]CSA54295.1 Uncharacterised protein [Vibrio cholerae]CSA62484.1 Uncharacterised protein [Vibrio cholerae]CSA65324.1 Uncharacterised protein [Vibrio cholerae]CSA68726.1 Uncharacterised protein [Vibrio cholerae]
MRILLNKAVGDRTNLIIKTISSIEMVHRRMRKTRRKTGGQIHIGTRKLVDGLPIITDRKQVTLALVLLTQRL